MRLTIYNVQHSDYGTVKCVGMFFPNFAWIIKAFPYAFLLQSTLAAKNPRGETDGTIRLYSKSNIKNFHINLHCMVVGSKILSFLPVGKS